MPLGMRPMGSRPLGAYFDLPDAATVTRYVFSSGEPTWSWMRSPAALGAGRIFVSGGKCFITHRPFKEGERFKDGGIASGGGTYWAPRSLGEIWAFNDPLYYDPDTGRLTTQAATGRIFFGTAREERGLTDPVGLACHLWRDN